MGSPFATHETGPRADVDAARAEARKRWHAFHEARREAVEKQDMTTDTTDKLQQLRTDAETASAKAVDAEGAWLASMASKEHGGPPRPVTSITDTVLAQMPDGIEGMKAITSGTFSVPSFFDEEFAALPSRAMFIQSILRTVAIQTPIYAYLQQITQTSGAAPVAPGGLKPTSVLTLQQVTVTPVTVATISEAIDRALLMDYVSLSTFLDQQLRTLVLLAVEDQVINGSGTAPNMRGILNQPGIATQPKGTDSEADAIAKAITQVRLAFIEPNAVVLHPSDWEAIRLSKASGSGDYLAAPIVEGDPPTLWGLQVVPSPVIAAGNALVGDFNIGAYLVQREDVTVDFASTGLGDAAGQELFSRNQLRARAEGRYGVAVPYPQAFCHVSGL
jgi:HK97 family phage major capsid protein